VKVLLESRNRRAPCRQAIQLHSRSKSLNAGLPRLVTLAAMKMNGVGLNGH